MMGRDKEERGPYSAIASVTLMIARELLRSSWRSKWGRLAKAAGVEKE